MRDAEVAQELARAGCLAQVVRAGRRAGVVLEDFALEEPLVEEDGVSHLRSCGRDGVLKDATLADLEHACSRCLGNGSRLERVGQVGSDALALIRLLEGSKTAAVIVESINEDLEDGLLVEAGASLHALGSHLRALVRKNADLAGAEGVLAALGHWDEDLRARLEVSEGANGVLGRAVLALRGGGSDELSVAAPGGTGVFREEVVASAHLVGLLGVRGLMAGRLVSGPRWLVEKACEDVLALGSAELLEPASVLVAEGMDLATALEVSTEL
jgi:hypothetical protein